MEESQVRTQSAVVFKCSAQQEAVFTSESFWFRRRWCLSRACWRQVTARPPLAMNAPVYYLRCSPIITNHCRWIIHVVCTVILMWALTVWDIWFSRAPSSGKVHKSSEVLWMNFRVILLWRWFISSWGKSPWCVGLYYESNLFKFL